MEKTCQGNILVVDDEVGIIKGLQNLLSKSGYLVHTAISGEEALNVLNQNSVDILATDFKMKDGMNGIELITNAKQKYVDLKCILFTAHGSYELALEAIEAESISFIPKPINPEVLRAALKKGMIKVNQIKDLRTALQKSEKELLQLKKDLQKSEKECLRMKATLLIKFSWYYYHYLNPQNNITDFADDINEEYGDIIWRITDGIAKTLYRYIKKGVPKNFGPKIAKIIVTAEYSLKLMINSKERFDENEINEFKELIDKFKTKVRVL
jgi:YesN/AraC family two-component response regulator